MPASGGRIRIIPTGGAGPVEDPDHCVAIGRQAQGGALETARAAGRKDNSLNMSEVLTRRLRDVFA